MRRREREPRGAEKARQHRTFRSRTGESGHLESYAFRERSGSAVATL
jgi:hypothetical protein